MRWVQHDAPEFEKRWQRYARSAGRSWRVDETYVKIRGEWCYLYRAVDRAGRTVDFRLSARRDVAAAKAFFRQAVKGQQRAPQTITLDGCAASHRAVRELKADGSLPSDTKLRSSKYLNNLIEQDHRGVKQRIAVMLGFKGFRHAAITIAGIELMHRIRKGVRANSDWAIWMFKAEPRLLFGTPCWELEVSAPHQGCVCPCSLFAPEPQKLLRGVTAMGLERSLDRSQAHPGNVRQVAHGDRTGRIRAQERLDIFCDVGRR